MISVSDLKQYFFCPRVVYFEHVLHVPKFKDIKLDEGKEKHEDITAREKRRKGAVFYDKNLDSAEKILKTYMESAKLGLNGILDYLIKTDNEYIPVEYKYGFSNSGKAYRNHKYQLVGYALLVEEHFHTMVRRGFIHYERDKTNVEVPVTEDLRNHVLKAMDEIKKMVDAEMEPKPTRQKKKCADCEYFKYCGGL